MGSLKIGEILMRRGACDAGALRTAWEQKVIFGDRLGTNLLALDLVDERELALALGEQHGVHAAYGEVLQVSPRAVQLVPRQLCLQRFVLPHHVQAGTMWLLMVDPRDVDAAREVKLAAGLKSVTPVVVTEARMWSLLAKHCGVGLSMRPIALDRPFGRLKKQQAEATAQGPAGDDLVSEDEFQRLYAGVFSNPGVEKDNVAYAPPPFDDATIEHRLPLPAPPSAAAAAFAALAAPPVATAPVPDLDVVEGTGGSTQPLFRIDPTIEMPAFADASGGPHEVVAPDPHGRPPPRVRTQTFDPGAVLAAAAATLPAPVTMPPGAPPADTSTWGAAVDADGLTAQDTLAGRALTLPEADIVLSSELQVEVVDLDVDLPLTFDQATQLLPGVKDRTGIARVVLRYARSRFARAALLTVHPHHIVGWEGIGDGLETPRLRTLVLDRTEPSVFTLVLQSKAPYLGPLQKLRGNGAWVKASGKQIPTSVVVLPILVRGNPINLLYLDNGHDAPAASGDERGGDVGELLILSQRIADSYEALLRGA